MPPLKIVLFGPPASGKSTLARVAPFLFPNEMLAFDMEGVGPAGRGLSPDRVRETRLPAQQALFEQFNEADFHRTFVLSPAYIGINRFPDAKWRMVFLLPESREHYIASVIQRNPDERQDYKTHYDNFLREYERRQDRPNVIRVSRLNTDGAARPPEETWDEIGNKLGCNWR